MSSKYDWVALTAEFLASDLTIQEFAYVKKIPLGTINKKAAEYKWIDARKEAGRKTVEKSVDLVSDDRANQLVEQNQIDLSGARKVIAVVMQRLEDAENLEMKDIRAGAAALKDAQYIARLALGANTEQSLSVSVEDWLNERVGE